MLLLRVDFGKDVSCAGFFAETKKEFIFDELMS